MTSRRCSRCDREKSIRGVWYLTPLLQGSTPFVCESCYTGLEPGVRSDPPLLS
jgi:hypothetical protein